ncbi:hypothetical protein [Nocardia bhagyanarayanae]|uniref:Secreted protein n=1 Tax=Nocardia bhagyanarayanae TaxID=1215925 RepID=A0A543EWH6_9NOCA|nr:hypothetical protein [Nocardia bhagyanarayanae]TQM25950.1 hypothetical protein FB390_6121 [Nocardia bhagyanarayanae]
MKRALLGILAAGLLLAAPAANAQEGDLIVNGTVIQDLVGCVQVADQPDELSVENNTDRVVGVYLDDQCQGDAAAMIEPGETRSVTGQFVTAS